ncbi:MAG: hypothetical protein VR76_07610 [Pseudomonas sp. BRH_c35]|nr:MAG: hypothetical protein VR76_07610 [Pseudomonas sp. BRH_c35]
MLLVSPIALAGPPKLIDADSFGASWPFTFEEAHLQCYPGRAVVVSDAETGRSYPVNGAASSKAGQFGLEPLDQVWRENTAIPGTKVSVGPVIEVGLGLCG